jgi:glycolate oxidase
MAEADIRQLAAEIRDVVGPQGLIERPEQLRVYDADGLTVFRQMPALVALPGTAEEVQGVVRLCHRHGVPFVPRGSGTGLSGGALPVEGGVVIGLSRLNHILEVDIPNQRAVVEPGVLNLWVTQRVAPQGYYYAPDPSSQQVCSIGGNVAENSGGAHCLKYGFTVNHVLGMEVVLPDGELVQLGGAALDTPGYDLPGIFVGSEGMLGIATKIILRIVRKPEAVKLTLASFAHTDAAGEAVSGIIGAGIIPAAVEMMDHLAIEACEAATHAGYPLDVGAVLLVELDGHRTEVAKQQEQVEAICRRAGALEIRIARDDEERALMWKGRKAAFAAMGRVSPNYIVQDGVIPRTTLPEVLREIAALSERYGLRVANVFHAGDGNLHPLVLYDERVPGEAERAEHVGGEILRVCLRYGGSVTGEHGVGHDKACYLGEQFSYADLETMDLLRGAFDPERRLNPDKVFPTPRLCGDRPGVYVPHEVERSGEAGRG